MLQSVFNFLSTFFVEIIYLFTSWYLPGTNVTPLGFALFFVMAYIAIRLVKHIVGAPGAGLGGGRDIS